jgi:hypothetical protein
MYLGVRHGCELYSYVGADPYAGFRKQVHGVIFKNFIFSRTERKEEEKSFFFVCKESNLNFSLFMDILVLPFFLSK